MVTTYPMESVRKIVLYPEPILALDLQRGLSFLLAAILRMSLDVSSWRQNCKSINVAHLEIDWKFGNIKRYIVVKDQRHVFELK